MSAIHLYTDGGVRPMLDLPLGTGFGGTGCVAICSSTQEVYFETAVFHPFEVTNQRMEMTAAIEGLTLIQKTRLNGLPVVIHSDSAYMINCFAQEWWYNWVVKQRGAWTNSSKKAVENRDLWLKLIGLMKSPVSRVIQTLGPRGYDKLFNDEDRDAFKTGMQTGLTVSFVKVKGHAGIPLNERADELATSGKNGNMIRRGSIFSQLEE